LTLFCCEQCAQFKAWHDDMNHQQIGDPAKPGSVMIQFAEMEQPLVRFAAVSDEAGKVLEKDESIRSEAEKWRSLSTWTDGEPASGK
jgi:hypothetical protein